MKKVAVVVFIVILTCCITIGCAGGVNMEEYNSIVQERDSLTEELNSLKSQNDTISAEKDDLQAQVTELTDNLTEKEEQLKKANDEITSLNTQLTTIQEETLIPQYKEEAEPVITAINEIGEVSLDSEEQIKSAQDLYNGLSDGAKEQVTNYSMLEEAENTWEDLKQKQEEEIGYDTGITFDQLSRNPDEYMLSKVKFSGRVLQVSESGDTSVIRLATSGNYDDVVMVGYNPALIDQRLLEGDRIEVYGISLGLTSYTTVLGAERTLPLISADRIEIK